MTTRLYIGNLPLQTTTSNLRKMFAELGRVKFADAFDDRKTGRSRGFGFVEMMSNEEAERAIEHFNKRGLDIRLLPRLKGQGLTLKQHQRASLLRMIRGSVTCLDIMQQEETYATADTPLVDVVKLIARERTDTILVVEQPEERSFLALSASSSRDKIDLEHPPDKLVGVITLSSLRDLKKSQKNFNRMLARNAVVKDFPTVLANEPVVNLIDKLGHKRVSRIPIVTEQDNLLGTISRDALKAAKDEHTIIKDAIDELLKVNFQPEYTRKLPRHIFKAVLDAEYKKRPGRDYLKQADARFLVDLDANPLRPRGSHDNSYAIIPQDSGLESGESQSAESVQSLTKRSEDEPPTGGGGATSPKKRARGGSAARGSTVRSSRSTRGSRARGAAATRADKSSFGETKTESTQLYMKLWIEDSTKKHLPDPALLLKDSKYKFLFAIEPSAELEGGKTSKFEETEELKKAGKTRVDLEVICPLLDVKGQPGYVRRKVDYYAGRGISRRAFPLLARSAGSYDLVVRVFHKRLILCREMLCIRVVDEGK